tara:strand:- start:60 stop:1109 length:1050 start_codon:yes stop_codon:yes gene_type:complete
MLIITIKIDYFSIVDSIMEKKYIIILLISSLVYGQPENELEIIVSSKKDFSFHPENIYVKNTLWYSEETDSLFTGRLTVYSKHGIQDKIVECTIIDGMKNGYYSQSYNLDAEVIGVNGIYVNNKKEGNWTWVEPEMDWKYQSRLGLDRQIITSIDYNNGIKNGHVLVFKSDIYNIENIQLGSHKSVLYLRGSYLNGKKHDIWYYYDDIFSDYDLDAIPYEIDGLYEVYKGNLLSYWTRKQIFNSSLMEEELCREPYEKIDCGVYENKYINMIYQFSPPTIVEDKQPQVSFGNTIKIQDNSGENVEVNLTEFIYHINQYHSKGVSIHKQNGRVFRIDSLLRERLNQANFW